MTRSLRRLLALATLLGALVFAATGQAQTSCSSALLRDWRDGRIDGTYPVACYRTALAQLPEDLRIYSSAESDIKRAALVGLGVAGQTDSLPVILDAARSADAATRLVALSALAGFRTPEVLRAMSAAATDGDESVRTAAIGFLAATPGANATAALVSLLPGAISVEQIVAALAVDEEGRVDGLSAALDGADDETASALTSALARLRRADATAALVAAMTNANSRARKAAAATLAGIGNKEALAVLRSAATDDPEPEVRRICALLLAR